jgi:DNA-binding CsgD family transcriptional regulator
VGTLRPALGLAARRIPSESREWRGRGAPGASLGPMHSTQGKEVGDDQARDPRQRSDASHPQQLEPGYAQSPPSSGGLCRRESVRIAQGLRAEGMTAREIAAEMGVARSTAGMWLTDPDGAKHQALRLRYRGTCRVCGRPTDGSNGASQAPTLCKPCSRATREQRSALSRDEVLRRFADGESPLEIGEACGVTSNAVRALLRRSGASPQAAQRTRPRTARRERVLCVECAAPMIEPSESGRCGFCLAEAAARSASRPPR